MPIKTTTTTKHDKIWNFYVNEIEKCDYLVALKKSGKPKAQSAGIRAMMHLYCLDEDFRNKVNTIIDNFIVYKKNGEISHL